MRKVDWLAKSGETGNTTIHRMPSIGHFGSEADGGKPNIEVRSADKAAVRWNRSNVRFIKTKVVRSLMRIIFTGTANFLTPVQDAVMVGGHDEAAVEALEID